MTYLTDLTAREAEIIRVLKILGLHKDRFVAIGGYAVNALASHRFSVDCDLVVEGKGRKFFDIILRREGYRKLKRARRLGIYGAHTEEYTKLVGGRRVSVDLFLNGVICRQTGGAWSYELIRGNSFESNVVGLTDSAASLVPKRELLLAMKIHSARHADLRDVVMLSEGADWNAVAQFARGGDKEKVIKQITSAIETIGSERFPSALRAEFYLRSDTAPLIRRAIDGLSKLKRSLLRCL